MNSYRYGALIAGKWRELGAEIFETRNPASPATVVGQYGASSAGEVADAIAAAIKAQSAWGALPATERIRLCSEFFAAIGRRGEDLAHAITLEQGKPLAEARNETSKALAEAAAMASHVLSSGSQSVPEARPGFQNMISRRPRGVIAAITPWNFPILTPMRKIAPALLFGNAIIVKPSEFTPATMCLIGEAAQETLPGGLVQIVLGSGRTGADLVGSVGIDGISFTGSVGTGRKIYALGAANLAELSLELGGKNAVIINDVDDLDACLDQVAAAAFMCAGQRCTAISRVLVAEALQNDVEAGLAARARRQTVGDGTQNGVTVGPLTNRAQFDKVCAMVQTSRSENARVVEGGRAHVTDPDRQGYFFQPTIISDVKPSMAAAREEIFGPVITISSYDTIDEAFAILNGVEYGLTSALFSQDASLIQRFIKESQNGMLHINHGTIPDSHMPFGGIKNSGVGAYSVGASAVSFYTTEHSVYLKAG